MFKSNFELAEERDDSIFGQTRLYKEKVSGRVEIMAKIIPIQISRDKSYFIESLDYRISNPHPNLLTVYKYELTESEDYMCSEACEVKVFIEYIDKSLKNEL